MYSKHKLLEIYDQIKAHSEKSNDPELADMAHKLHEEIRAMDDSATDDSGGSAPPPDKGRGN